MNVTKHRILHLYQFETWLRNGPRVGPLQKALAVPQGVTVATAAYDRLRRLYLNGELSNDLLEQFREWLIDQSERG